MQLNFESETFAGIKRDMNFVLQRLLGNMQQKGASDGSMTVKIEVSFDKEFIPNYDPNIEGESREIAKPKFKHKVTSAVQIKDEKSGNLDTEMELAFDEDTGEYVMKPIANTQQRSIFDSDFGTDETDSNGDNTEERDVGIKSLPGPVENSDEVIDAEFKEVTDEKEAKYETEGIEEASEAEGDNNNSFDGEDYEDVTDELIGDDENGEDDYGYEDPEEEE